MSGMSLVHTKELPYGGGYFLLATRGYFNLADDKYPLEKEFDSTGIVSQSMLRNSKYDVVLYCTYQLVQAAAMGTFKMPSITRNLHNSAL
jgi:hypothetical protein